MSKLYNKTDKHASRLQNELKSFHFQGQWSICKLKMFLFRETRLCQQKAWIKMGLSFPHRRCCQSIITGNAPSLITANKYFPVENAYYGEHETGNSYKFNAFALFFYMHREKGRDLTQSHKNATKNFDYTTIADRLMAASWSNDSHATGVFKSVNRIPTIPINTTVLLSRDIILQEAHIWIHKVSTENNIEKIV